MTLGNNLFVWLASTSLNFVFLEHFVISEKIYRQDFKNSNYFINVTLVSKGRKNQTHNMQDITNTNLAKDVKGRVKKNPAYG